MSLLVGQYFKVAEKAIASGDLARRVEAKGMQEIETLGQSFNQMAFQLQQSFSELATTNRNLEAKVIERTADLSSANQEITVLNQRLQVENTRMGSELDVLRQLQQMILPRASELAAIDELDIAAFMQPANEVGGDYYDILQRGGVIRIGIGDITGHGLESGVLMIMTQTAVRTLLATEIRDPVQVLNILNQVIYENIQRMNSHKHLTLILLDYRDDTLFLSGQHEEVLVVKADGTVERVDTIDLGFPIGIVDEISPYVAQVPIKLNSGDSVVLYTDGITEAENEKRELYGMDKFIKVLQAHYQQTADAIRVAVIQDVEQHIGESIIYDDITLVVIKKK